MKFVPTASMTVLILLAMELYKLKQCSAFLATKHQSQTAILFVTASRHPWTRRTLIKSSPIAANTEFHNLSLPAPADTFCEGHGGRETRRLKVTFLSVPLNIASYCCGAVESRPWLRNCRDISYLASAFHIC